jgi:CRP/FNR family transcriptional regulator
LNFVVDFLKLLTGSYLCSGLEKEEVEAIAAIAVSRKLRKGELLFIEGDPAGGFFVLLTGRIRIYKASAEGKEYTIHQIRPGQLFAEAAIFKGDKFPANAMATVDSLVAFFPRGAFANLLRNSPQISLKIIGSLSGFVRDFNRQVEDLSLKEVPARIASFLLNQSEEKNNMRFSLDIPKSELARRLGTVSETLSRGLGRLKEAGLIKVEKNEIQILDPSGLSSVADGQKF